MPEQPSAERPPLPEQQPIEQGDAPAVAPSRGLRLPDRAAVRRLILSGLDAVPVLVWVVLGAGVILGISALFGGLETAERESVTIAELAPGDTHDGPQFSVSVHDISVTNVAPGSTFPADDGLEYIVARVTITNNWIETTFLLDSAVTLEWLDDDYRKPERIVLLADGTTLPQANPRVPIDVAFVWQVPAGEVRAGDTVRATITEATLRTDYKLTFGAYWYDPRPAAELDLVLTESRQPVEDE